MATQRTQQGFTLIEIAIVLVIIGLLLGGILKGQELITSARVRSLISQQDGIKAAFYGFQDRYRALPGDYAAATTNIQGLGANENGNNNGRIETAGAVVASSKPEEHILAWAHLSRSGFINGNFVFSATESDTTTPKNPYGRPVRLAYDANYGNPAATNPARHNLKTGNQIPVEISAEVDRKIDDGNPVTGSFVFSTYIDGTATLTAPGAAPACLSAALIWQLTGGTTSVDCGGASLM
jgi:prepilin-type N-terminal cleavage/methylation domain-containing protein